MADGSHTFTQDEIDLLLQNVDQLSEQEVRELYDIVDDLANRQRLQHLRDDLIAFCQHMQDDYKVGAHHRRLAGLLEDIEARRKDRICVSIPPRHGKSQMVSIYYAAWYMGRNPSHKVMLVSHTTDLAVDFGRKIRNIVATERYKEVFPNVSLASDSKSAGRWNTNHGGEFFAAGVGSALAGRGAHMLIVDDPHSEQDVLAGNFSVFQKAYEWFTFGARTRLMPGGAVAVVHCMVGDTSVLMANGAEKPLRDLRPGDMVASYDGTKLVSKKVLNWANQGSDRIYTIRLNNGNLIRANARHPFLVVKNGVEQWVRVRDLLPGDRLVSLKGAPVQRSQTALLGDVRFARTGCSDTERPPEGGQKSSLQRSVSLNTVKILPDQKALRGSAQPVYPETATTERTPEGQSMAPATGASGQGKPAQLMDAPPRPRQGVYVARTTASSTMLPGEGGAPESRTVTPSCVTDMASVSKSTPECGGRRGVNAPSAMSRPTNKMYQPAGTGALLLTTATTQVGSEPSCATSATSWSDMGQTKAGSFEVLSTYELTNTQIVSITPSGEEDVFDIQVEDTENFIASGVVSHNTRWHQSDLIGRLTNDMVKHDGSDQYEVFEFPAIMELTDPETGAPVQKALWPEFFDLPALLRTKASMGAYQWNAQYQQQPTAEEAALVKREWWRKWEKDQPPPCDYIIMSLDAAAETHNRADYTGITTWGVFHNDSEGATNVILLHSTKERLEFPELKRRALEMYRDWEPDSFIVEKKSAGVALYQELRRMGIPVQEFTPHRGSGDKVARLNSVSDIVSSGLVWVPDRRWAEELVEEVAAFPFGANDDLVDCTTMALLRFRQGGFVALPSDEWDDDTRTLPRRADYY
jgi:predicted phage terminase large subunit-like protein